jgi:outer membrane protein OmpA-like peptidoglycan-associated protein/Tfp pilus assembly protein PilF
MRILVNKTTWVMSVMLLLAVAAWAQSSKGRTGGKQAPTDKTNLTIAKEYLKYEEYQKALPYVDKLLDEQPENPYYNFWMGKCLFFSYKKNMALAHFEKVNKLNPNVDKDFHYYYALALHYNYDFERAKDEYRLAIEEFRPKSPSYEEIQKRMGQCDYGQRQMDNKNQDWERIFIENTGPSINSEYAEHSPIISANDSILLYTARRPECLGAMPSQHYYDEDLYVSFKRGDVWSKGLNIGRPVNSAGHDATISLTADGRTLYIYRHKADGGLYVTDFDTLGKQWTEPNKVERPLNSKYYEACISVSADGTKLFFSSDRPGGMGGRDIYMVKKNESGKWGEPANLGPTVNTQWNDDAPYFHPDNKTLYYSSDGPNSIGGWDIFVTEYLEDQDKWLAPLNMGYPVNTPDDDIYFVLAANGMTGYYSSGKEGGYGEKDIYTIYFPYYPYPRRYFSIQLEGIVMDEETNDTLPATVRLMDHSTHNIQVSVINKRNPKLFHFDLDPEHEYTIEVVADGYPLHTEELTSPKLFGKDIRIEKNILLRQRPEIVTEKGEKFPEIMHIYYDFDKYGLRDESKIELDAVVAMLTQNKDMKLQVHGHTDWYNNVDYNIELSLNRCRTPLAYLIEQGIDPARIEMKNFSENKPLDTNDNDTGRQFNRRAEFHFVRGEEVVYSSVKLRSGVSSIRVDHAPPQGLPGYDRPEMVEFMAQGSQPESFPEHIRQSEVAPSYANAHPNFRINLTIVDWK